MSHGNWELKVFRRRNGKCEGSFRCAIIWLGGVWLLKRFNNKFYWTPIVNQRMPLSLFIQHLQVLFLFSSEIEEGGENVDKSEKD